MLEIFDRSEAFAAFMLVALTLSVYLAASDDNEGSEF